MTDKELQKLSRTELLELLISQTEENERLKKQIEASSAKLTDRQINIENAGSIAEASLMLNGVFEAAEKAAKQYLENIERLNDNTENECRSIRENAEKEAADILKNAADEGDKIRAKAEAYWRAVVERATVILNNQDALRSTLQSAISTPVEGSNGEED